MVTTVSSAVIIILASITIASWVQVIFPSIPVEKRSSPSFIKLEACSAIEILYLLIGLWFGILGKLMEYSWHIRKKIAEL